MDYRKIPTDARITQHSMGTGYLVEPTLTNSLIPLLQPYRVQPSQIIGVMYEGDALQGLDARFKDYLAVFFGVSPDKELPTRILFEKEDEVVFFCRRILIYVGDSRNACIDAMWSVEQGDFTVAIKRGHLEALNLKAGKRLADGLALLMLIEDRLRPAGDARPYDPWDGRLPIYKETVDDWYDVVDYIRKFSKEKKRDNSAGMVRESREYKRLSEGRDEKWLNLIIDVIAYRMRQLSEANKSGNKAKQRKCRIALGALGLTSIPFK